MTGRGLFVHICCAPDGLYVMDLLKREYDITGFFYNPNIHPAEEYQLRLEEAGKIARVVGFELIEGPYDDDRWLRVTKKFAAEPEKGRRCDVCYAMRLGRTALEASSRGFGLFATIMSLSPWKKAQVLNRIGGMFGRRYGLNFLAADFKKKDGFRKSVELSKRHGLYRQDYCGCLYSQRKRSAG